MINRRGLITGLGAVFVTAPAIVRYESLMVLPRYTGPWFELLFDDKRLGITGKYLEKEPVFPALYPTNFAPLKFSTLIVANGIRIYNSRRELARKPLVNQINLMRMCDAG